MTAAEREKLRHECLDAGYSVITGSIKDSTNVQVRVMIKDRSVDKALLSRVYAAGRSVER